MCINTNDRTCPLFEAPTLSRTVPSLCLKGPASVLRCPQVSLLTMPSLCFNVP